MECGQFNLNSPQLTKRASSKYWIVHNPGMHLWAMGVCWSRWRRCSKKKWQLRHVTWMQHGPC